MSMYIKCLGLFFSDKLFSWNKKVRIRQAASRYLGICYFLFAPLMRTFNVYILITFMYLMEISSSKIKHVHDQCWTEKKNWFWFDLYVLFIEKKTLFWLLTKTKIQADVQGDPQKVPPMKVSITWEICFACLFIFGTSKL